MNVAFGAYSFHGSAISDNLARFRGDPFDADRFRGEEETGDTERFFVLAPPLFRCPPMPRRLSCRD